MDFRNRFAIAAAVLAIAACSVTPPRSRWISYEEVHPAIRKHLEMRPDELVLSCRNMVHVGERRRKDESELDQIVIADGPASYYDNLRGEEIQNCNYWYCTRNNAECDARCPVRAWDCPNTG